MANYEQVFKNIESLLNKNKVKGASFVVLNEEGILYSNQLGVSDKEKEGDIIIDQNTKFPLDKMKKLFSLCLLTAMLLTAAGAGAVDTYETEDYVHDIN